MKKFLLKLTAVVFVAGAIFGCSEDKVFYSEGSAPTAARFEIGSSAFPVGETSARWTHKYKVIASSKSDVERKISISLDPNASTANIGDYIELVSSTLVIPAGSYEGEVSVRFKKAYEDISFENDLQAMLVLDAVEGASTNDNYNKRLLLTIFKDCDYESSVIASTVWQADAVSVETESFPGGTPDTYDVTMTVNPNNPKEITVNTLWGPNMIAAILKDPKYNGQLPLPGKITIDTEYNTIKVVGSGTNEPYVIDGAGTYDACNNIFKYSFTGGMFDGIKFTVDVVVYPKVAE